MPVKIKANRVLCAIAIFIALLPSATQAQQATVFKDSTGRIFLYGQQPNTRVGVVITGDFSKTIQANSCGLVLINPNSSLSGATFQIDGQTINPTTISDVRSLSSNCSQMASYPVVFKTVNNAIAIKKTPGADYTVTFPNHKVTRQVLINSCGYAVLKNTNISSLNLTTATGGRADFAYTSLPVAQSLSCVKGTLYFSKGFDPKSAIASGTSPSAIASGTSPSATTTATTTASTTTTTTAAQQPTNSTSSVVSAQTAQPKAAKSGNSLIISSIPPGTYTVANAANLTQSKTYTVTSKACLVSDRTQVGSPSKFLISRQGVTFPIDWASLTEVPAGGVPSC